MHPADLSGFFICASRYDLCGAPVGSGDLNVIFSANKQPVEHFGRKMCDQADNSAHVSLEKEGNDLDVGVDERLTMSAVPKGLNGNIVFFGIKIVDNIERYFLNAAFVESLKAQKPASLKGQYVKSVFISTTMGPSIQVENIYN